MMMMDASGCRRPVRLRDRDLGKPFVLCRIGGNWVRFVKRAAGLGWFRLGIGIGFVSHFPEWRGEERGQTHKTRWTPHPRDAPPFGNRDVGKPCILWGFRENWVRFVKRAAGLGWLGLGVGIGFVWHFPESVGKNAGGPTDGVGKGPVTDAGTPGATGTELGSFRISGFRAFRRLELARLAAICSENTEFGEFGTRLFFRLQSRTRRGFSLKFDLVKRREGLGCFLRVGGDSRTGSLVPAFGLGPIRVRGVSRE